LVCDQEKLDVNQSLKGARSACIHRVSILEEYPQIRAVYVTTDEEMPEELRTDVVGVDVFGYFGYSSF